MAKYTYEVKVEVMEPPLHMSYSNRGHVQTTWTNEGGGGCSDDHNT